MCEGVVVETNEVRSFWTLTIMIVNWETISSMVFIAESVAGIAKGYTVLGVCGFRHRIIKIRRARRRNGQRRRGRR